MCVLSFYMWVLCKDMLTIEIENLCILRHNRKIDLLILFYWPGQEIDARENYQTLSEFRIQQYLTDMSKQNMKYKWIEVTVLVMHDHESEGCQVYPWTMPPRKHCGGKKLADVWSSWPTAAWSRVWWWTWCHTGQFWFLEFVVKTYFTGRCHIHLSWNKI